MRDEKPSVGATVHYKSYGTPNGEYGPECRAAIVTAVKSAGAVSLAVLNPTGAFFNQYVNQHQLGLDADPRAEHRGGTWHWAEKGCEQR